MCPTILNVNINLDVIGGSDQYFIRLGELLKSRSYEVINFTRNDLNSNNISLKKIIYYYYNNEARLKILDVIKNNKITLAHLHIYYGKITSSILTPLKEANIPIIQSLHEYKLLCPVYTMLSGDKICNDCKGKSFYRAIPKKCKNQKYIDTLAVVLESYISSILGNVSKIDHFIPVSEFMKKQMLSIGIPNSKLTTIHNYVDVTNLHPTNIKQDYIIYFGRIEKLKGLQTLVSAIEPFQNLRLLLVGDGKYKQELQEFIRTRNLKNIEFINHLSFDKLKSLISGAVCSVVPSEWYENCPMSVLESYGLGTMVIGSNIGGIPELINDKVDGFLFNPGEVLQLREIFNWVINNKSASIKMGQLGRKKIEEQFNARIHFEKIQTVYNKYI